MLNQEVRNTMKKLLTSIIIIALLAALLVTITSCQDFGFPSTTPEETPAPEPVKTVSSTTVSSRDAAILAVYQHLLEEAGSYKAKLYLADFYTTCDNWTAQSDYFKDGSGTWHVVIDMTAIENWEFHPYWQQASWLVFKDGKVIPSNLFEANALRIEADLQSLSTELTAE